MRRIRSYWAIFAALLIAPTAPLAAQALYGTFTSHTDGQSVTSPNINITWEGCSNTEQSFYQTRVNGSSVVTTQSNGQPCPDYSIGKNYSASATLVNGANSLYLRVCDLVDCGESMITVYYLAAGVSVTPDGATAPSVPHRTSSSYAFTVTNTGGLAATAAFSHSCSGSLASCSVSPASAFIAPGAAATATVSYTGATVGSGQAWLTATYNEYPTVSDNGFVNVSVTENPIWGVSVVPQNANQSVTAGTNRLIRFDVQNTSQYTSSASTFALSTTSSPSVSSCSLSTSSLTLYPGDPPTEVIASCTISSSGTSGSVTLTATASSPEPFSGSGTTNLTIGPTYNVSLTAVSSKTEPAGTTSDLIAFTLTNNSQNSGPILFSFNQSCTGVVTCGDPINSVSVAEGGSTTVNLPYNVSLAGATGEISLTATSVAPSQTKVVSIATTPDYVISLSSAGSQTLAAGSSFGSTPFTITNTSANSAASLVIDVVSGCSDIVSLCSPSQAQVTLSQGGQASATASYAVSLSGTSGNISLTGSPGSGSPAFTSKTSTTIVNATPRYAVTVTPAAGSITLPAGATGGTSSYTIQNTSTNTSGPITFTLTATCTPVASCTASQGTTALAEGASSTKVVSFNVSGSGTGSVALAASSASPSVPAVSGTTTVTVTAQAPVYGVSVQPVNPTQTVSAGTATIRFDVANTSQNTSTPSTFTLTSTTAPAVSSCSLSPASLTLYPGDPPTEVIATCTISSSETSGSVTLTASTTSPASFSGNGTANVTVAPTYSVSLTAATSKTEPPGATSDTVTFTITNNSQNTGPILFEFTATCELVVSCADPVNSVSLASGASAPVSVAYNINAVGTNGQITLAATSVAPTQTRAVSIVTTPAYAVSVTPLADSIALAAGSVNGSSSYTVQNTSTNTSGPVTFTLSATCTPVASCTASQGTTALAQGASSTKVVSFNVSGPGTGTVALAASSASPSVPAVTGMTTVTVASTSTEPSYSVSVTPVSPSVTLAAGTINGSSDFTILNTSTNTSGPITFTLTAACAGIASCSSSQGAVALAEGASATRSVSYSVSLTGVSGSVSLAASSVSPSVPIVTGTTAVNATPSYAIAVIPATGSATASAGTSKTYSVAIQNLSTNSANPITVSLASPSCTGVVVGNCSVLANSASIAQGAQTSPLTLSYDALASSPTPETIALNASGTVTGGTVQVTNASLSVTVTAVPPPGGTMTLVKRNSGTTTDKRSCLTVAAGQNAAYECGDLRVVHELPATVTMDRARGPALIYNSRQANPVALVTADVTYPGTAPTGLKAIVSIAGQVNVERDFQWNPECAANPCRIVVPVPTTQVTAMYETILKVKAMNGAAAVDSASVTDTVVVVNRASSPFGAGWWVDGLESLVSAGTTQMLWIGGDGSTRLYTRTSDNSVYTVSPAYERPDTLRKLQGSQGWRRSLGDSGYVQFSNQGRHTATVNSLGWTTRFVYSGQGGSASLDSLVLPVPASSSAARGYRFLYTSGLLTSVQAPSAALARTTQVNRTGALVNSITDPDGLATTFGYDASKRITTRRNKLNDTTYFDYDGGGALRQAKLSIARTNGADSAVTTTFRAAETRSVYDAADLPTLLAKVYTKLDGPRSDVGDTTAVFVNRWGAPDSVTNALGQRTRVSRANAAFPALVTKVVAPGGFETRAFFNARALIDSTVAIDPYGTGNAVTRFSWNPQWNRVDSVIDPTNRRTRTFYRSTRPIVDSVRTGTDVARRVKFSYTADNQLRSVTEPGGLPDSVQYDALGNAMKTWTPLGRADSVQYFTQFFKDAIGRDTLVVRPVSGAITDTTRIKYDVADRVIRTVSSGSARSYTLSVSGFERDTAAITALSKTDSSGYDAEGNLVFKTSVGSPWVSEVSVTENMKYDAAGRLTKRLVGTGPDSMVYDPAGNLVAARHHSGAWVTQSYDALNRVTMRVVPEVVTGQGRCSGYLNGPLFTSIDDCHMVFPYYPNAGDSLRIPADTSRFVYDPVNGYLREANNRYARVRRAYYAGGALKSDSTVLGLYSSPLVDDARRGQQFIYDLAGRRTSMEWQLGATGYSYNDFGSLAAITDPHGGQYRFTYDLKGQLDSLILGTGVKETRSYDADGRLISKNRVSSYGTLGTLVSDGLDYDYLNRVISVSEQRSQQQAEQTLLSYDAMGAVLAKEQAIGPPSGSSHVEEFRNDAFGNVIRRRTRGTAGLINDAPFVMQYGPMGDLMSSIAQVTDPLAQNQREDEVSQTGDGSQLEKQSEVVKIPNGGDYTLQIAARHYYGADDRLMAVQRYSYRSLDTGDGSWEEYWYDALGRRVLTRARRDPNPLIPSNMSGPLCSGANILCRSFKERVWWDGDQALLEERSADGTADVSNSGIIGNIHGLTLDEPLAVIGSEPTRIINYNWRGQGASSVFLDGAPGDISLGNTSTEIDWPAATQAATYYAASPDASPSPTAKRWMGTFVASGQGTTGMLYRRNRYFDPKSGQFTQADPIGIAGGMNVFGFAAGDPVNFSDPFGLCTPWPECMLQSAANWGAAHGGTVGGVALNVGAGLNAASEAFGTNELGKAIGSGNAVGAAVALAGMLPVGKVGKVGRVVREFEGGSLAAHEALLAAERWLGTGYREISSGVFRSADKTRQFRMTANDLVKDLRKGPHVHFEAIAEDGREIIESTWVRIKQ